MNHLWLLANSAIYGGGGVLFTLMLLVAIIGIEQYVLQKLLHFQRHDQQKKALLAVILANILSTYPGGIVAAALDWELTWRWDRSRLIVLVIFFSVTLLIESPVTIMTLRKMASVKAIFQATLLGNLVTYALLFIWLTHWFSVDFPSKQKTTMSTMRALGTAIGSYQVDYDSFPIQKSLGNIQDVGLPEAYYRGGYKDRWRTPIQYISDGSSYTLMSYGRDRQPGGKGFDAELLFSNGRAVWPQPEENDEKTLRGND